MNTPAWNNYSVTFTPTYVTAMNGSCYALDAAGDVYHFMALASTWIPVKRIIIIIIISIVTSCNTFIIVFFVSFIVIIILWRFQDQDLIQWYPFLPVVMDALLQVIVQIMAFFILMVIGLLYVFTSFLLFSFLITPFCIPFNYYWY